MSGKRVLVVDDDVKTVELVKLYLNRDGYKVITAHDGVEALRLARERSCYVSSGLVCAERTYTSTMAAIPSRPIR